MTPQQILEECGCQAIIGADIREAHFWLMEKVPYKAWCAAGNKLTEAAVAIDPRGWASPTRLRDSEKIGLIAAYGVRAR